MRKTNILAQEEDPRLAQDEDVLLAHEEDSLTAQEDQSFRFGPLRGHEETCQWAVEYEGATEHVESSTLLGRKGGSLSGYRALKRALVCQLVQLHRGRGFRHGHSREGRV